MERVKPESEGIKWRNLSSDVVEEAKRKDMPIFVYDGYTACYWCREIEKNVFSDLDVIQSINSRFIPCKVDKIEHPEIDSILITTCTLLNGCGGWPLCAVLDHQGIPFFSFLYQPLDHFKKTIDNIFNTWNSNRDQIQQICSSLKRMLEARLGDPVVPSPIITEKARKENLIGESSILKRHRHSRKLPNGMRTFIKFKEELEGRFSEACPTLSPIGSPNFPQVNELLALIASTSPMDPSIAHLVVRTLETMMDSAIHDRIGGGFFRYTSDREWKLPHFEKMLYSNAGLMACYALAGQQYDRPDFVRVAERILMWMDEEMRVTDERGDFAGYAASLDGFDDHGEGSYYMWDSGLLKKILGKEDSVDACLMWGIVAKKDEEEEPSLSQGEEGQEMPGELQPSKEEEIEMIRKEERRRKHLAAQKDLMRSMRFSNYLPHPFSSPAFGVLSAEGRMTQRTTEISWCERLREWRKTHRKLPNRDDKTVTAWNALVLRGVAALACVTGKEEYTMKVYELYNFLNTRIERPLTVMRLDGIPGHVNDFGCLAVGLLAGYRATGDVKFVRDAMEVIVEAYHRLRAPDGGFYTSSRSPLLFLRSREVCDSAIPSGQSSIAMACIRLFQLTSDYKWHRICEDILFSSLTFLETMPTSTPTLVRVLKEMSRPSSCVLVSGEKVEKQQQEICKIVRSVTPPRYSIISLAEADEMGWALAVRYRHEFFPRVIVEVGAVEQFRENAEEIVRDDGAFFKSELWRIERIMDDNESIEIDEKMEKPLEPKERTHEETIPGKGEIEREILTAEGVDEAAGLDSPVV
ncbi:Spermatogenesis-associated protein 20 like protein [Aduncisulcus paluster]|uniref:Spermatogenesis-associated protein 20 like protein n=1 Tax=Aduncisulcus paluster TaxID=2918883 RepID=A0ABQ5K5J9_9EUKA|nr:Spermatogenesis-associated protein 20 like protein [Aduncisulcus paluster]